MKAIFIGILLILSLGLFSQGIPKWKENIDFSGYLKELQTITFVDNPVDFISGNILHNRLNFKYYFNEKWTFGSGLRTQLYFGESVRFNPFLAKSINHDNGILKLGGLVFEDDAAFLHSGFDRLWIDFAGEKFSFRLGRQRINWGINLAWNPNDIFNNYDITDFDYEERPGVDALKMNYLFDKKGELSFAMNFDTIFEKINMAAMYKFNKNEYDFQFLAGKYQKDLTIGFGWAGNLKNAGFKGEINGFYSDEKEFCFVSSIGLDYSTKGGMYIYFGQLFNSSGTNENIDLSVLFSGENSLSPKKLMPTKHSSLLQLNYQLSPPWTISGVGIFGYGSNLFFISPSISYSIADNWDIMLLSQHFAILKNENSINSNSIYLRLKWSF